MDSGNQTVVLIVLIAISVLLPTTGQAESLQKKWRESFKFDKDSLIAPVVIVDNINGSIEVMGHEGSEIFVVVNVHLSARRERDLKQAEDELKLLVEQTTNGLLFYLQTPYREGCGYFNRSRGYSFEYDFIIMIPQGIKLDLSTVNNGDIAVKDLDANFVIAQVNGNVHLTGMSGSGSVEAVNGDITIDYVREPEEDTVMSTVNGNILVGFNSVPSTDVYLATAYGVLMSDFGFKVLPDRGAVITEKKGGLTRYLREPYTRIRLRNGGPVMKLKSFVGDIRIRQNTRRKNS